MKITVEVDEYTTNQMLKNTNSNKTIWEAAHIFAQNIINRYYGVEHMEEDVLDE